MSIYEIEYYGAYSHYRNVLILSKTLDELRKEILKAPYPMTYLFFRMRILKKFKNRNAVLHIMWDISSKREDEYLTLNRPRARIESGKWIPTKNNEILKAVRLLLKSKNLYIGKYNLEWKEL